MRRVGRVNGFLAVCVVASLTLAACTSKSKTTPSSPASSGSTSASAAPSSGAASPAASSVAASSAPAAAGPAEDLNNSGTPVKGGTLHMLGVGDVDYMDPNISYYSSGYMAARLYSRQLVTFPAIAGQGHD